MSKIEVYERILFSFALVLLLSSSFVSCSICTNVDSDSVVRNPLWLHTNGTRIVDEYGRIVVLRGCNYMGLNFGKYVHKESDFAQMKSWGFNVVRIPIAWSYIEPSPRVYDDSYLLNLDNIIDWCKKYGIYVLPDMHQWQWSPKFGGDGAPNWACSQWSTKEAAEEGFWKNVTLQDHLIGAWMHVAERYANESSVCGYDLFNEPGMHWKVPDNILYDFYNRTINAIRSVDSRHNILIEPPYYFGSPQKIDQPNIVLSTHLYTYGITGNYDGDIDRLERHILQGYNKATQWGIPFWVGEFAIDSRVSRAQDWCRDYLTLMDKYMIGSAWWSYWRDDSSESFYLLDSQGREKPVFIDILNRPYPVSSGTTIGSFSYNVTTKAFRMSMISKENSSVLIHVPERHYPQGFGISCNATQWDYSWNHTDQILDVSINSSGTSSIRIDPSVEGLQNEIQRLEQILETTEEQNALLTKTCVLLVIALVISNSYCYFRTKRRMTRTRTT